jgi:hypothetical protein
LPVNFQSGTTSLPPSAQFTVMAAGASAALSTWVMTKCHSFALHSWSVSAFAEITWVSVVTVTVDELLVAWAEPMPSQGTTASAATIAPATRSERTCNVDLMPSDLQDDALWGRSHH